MKKNAFTLAEIMIVLGIIAVLAGIAIMAITSARPDQDIVMYKKAYSTAQRAIANILTDKSFYPDADKLALLDDKKLILKALKNYHNASGHLTAAMSEEPSLWDDPIPWTTGTTTTIPMTYTDYETQGILTGIMITQGWTRRPTVYPTSNITTKITSGMFPSGVTGKISSGMFTSGATGKFSTGMFTSGVTGKFSTGIIPSGVLPSSLIESMISISKFNEIAQGPIILGKGFTDTTITDSARSIDSSISTSNKFIKLFVNQMSTVGAATYNGNNVKFTTADGIYWDVTDKFSSDEQATITVYTSGQETVSTACSYSSSCKVPNKFTMTIEKTGRIIPDDAYGKAILDNPNINKNKKILEIIPE